MARGGVAGIGLFFVALGKWDHYMEKKKNHYLTLYTKVDSRRNDDLNVKNKTMASTKETG